MQALNVGVVVGDQRALLGAQHVTDEIAFGHVAGDHTGQVIQLPAGKFHAADIGQINGGEGQADGKIDIRELARNGGDRFYHLGERGDDEIHAFPGVGAKDFLVLGSVGRLVDGAFDVIEVIQRLLEVVVHVIGRAAAAQRVGDDHDDIQFVSAFVPRGGGILLAAAGQYGDQHQAGQQGC